jgi:hypothetical protein
MRHGCPQLQQELDISGFLLTADVISEIYGVLQSSARNFERTGAHDCAEHARYLAFQLLDAPYI